MEQGGGPYQHRARGCWYCPDVLQVLESDFGFFKPVWEIGVVMISAFYFSLGLDDGG
jgi:hypothetical protein